MSQLALSQVDAKSRLTWRPYFAYLFNQAAQGRNTADVLAVWYAWITKESGTTIHGNNPLNMTCSKGDGCYAGQIGWYQFPGNSLKFAAFDTPQHGAQAAVALIGSDRQNPAIITAAHNGDANGMIAQIAKACWLGCGDKNVAYANSIRSIAESRNIVTLVGRDISANVFANIPGGGTVPAGNLGAWNNLVSFPTGHILTSADVDSIIATLDKAGIFNGSLLALGVDHDSAKQKAHDILMGHVGQAWNQSLEEAIAGEFGVAAVKATDNPLQSIANVAVSLTNPNTYVHTGAFIIGLVLAFTGFRMLMQSGQGSTAVV